MTKFSDNVSTRKKKLVTHATCFQRTTWCLSSGIFFHPVTNFVYSPRYIPENSLAQIKWSQTCIDMYRTECALKNREAEKNFVFFSPFSHHQLNVILHKIKRKDCFYFICRAVFFHLRWTLRAIRRRFHRFSSLIERCKIYDAPLSDFDVFFPQPFSRHPRFFSDEGKPRLVLT